MVKPILGSLLATLELQHSDEKIQVLKKNCLEEEGRDPPTRTSRFPAKYLAYFTPSKEILGSWIYVGRGLQSSRGSMSCSKQPVAHLFISSLLSQRLIQGRGPKKSLNLYHLPCGSTSPNAYWVPKPIARRVSPRCLALASTSFARCRC